MTLPAKEILSKIAAIVGPKGMITDDKGKAPYLMERREKYHGKTAAVVRPKTTDEVAAVVKIAFNNEIGIVPQSGNTGLVGGQIPNVDGSEILLSLDRMTTIREIDIDNNIMRVDAGCILATVHQEAEAVGRMFPLSLASQGSARIGGLLATNAGGTNVLRFGTIREQVLGLEVVLPDGKVWDGLRALRKDNTGYDLKQLFIGAEGTLGVITGAVLKLYPKVQNRATAFVGLTSPAQAVALLTQSRNDVGESISGFELMPRRGLEFVLAHKSGARDPLNQPHAWYVLVELSSSDTSKTLDAQLEKLLQRAEKEGIVADAAIATSQAQANDFWALREHLSEAQKPEGGSIKHDVSLPISRVSEFLAMAEDAVAKTCPGIRPVPFGHLGDGNIHFNLSQPVAMDKQAFLELWPEINRLVHDIVHELGGSISAEHGIGQMKRKEITRYKSSVEIDLMRKLKQAMDPKGLMNPGKVI